jgi:hypothetical protein
MRNFERWHGRLAHAKGFRSLRTAESHTPRATRTGWKPVPRLCMLVLMLAASCVRADELFSATRAHTIDLSLSADAWKLMQPGAGSHAVRAAVSAKKTAPADVALRHGSAGEGPYAYVAADITFDGQSLDGVGIRFKGGLSYSSSVGPRRPMKLDFGRFVDGRHFAGLATLNLNNQALDPSQAREALAFHLFRATGVPAPRTGFALVTLTVPGLYDHEFLGLYTLIEEVDGRFLKRNFTDPGGLLLKPGGMRGLAYFGDDWRQYTPYLPKSDPVDPALARRVVDLATLVHRADDAAFASRVGGLLDVDEFLGYVAVNAALTNFDSFLSTGHNYYLYVRPEDQRLVFIPWDLNMSFGGYSWVGSTAEVADTSITHPYVDHNRLIERVLAIPAYRQLYDQHLRRLTAPGKGAFTPESVRRRLAKFEPVFAAATESATRAGKYNSPATRPALTDRLDPPPLLPYVEARAASIRAQLAGQRPGHIPAFVDPDRVPAGWATIVRPAAALLAALDADHDGRVSETEARRAIDPLFTSKATTRPNEPFLDEPALAAALAPLLTDDQRRCAAPQAWASWLFRAGARADRKSDRRRLSPDDLLALYRRWLASDDLDHDGQLAGREIIEAMSGVGPP